MNDLKMLSCFGRRLTYRLGLLSLAMTVVFPMASLAQTTALSTKPTPRPVLSPTPTPARPVLKPTPTPTLPPKTTATPRQIDKDETEKSIRSDEPIVSEPESPAQLPTAEPAGLIEKLKPSLGVNFAFGLPTPFKYGIAASAALNPWWRVEAIHMSGGLSVGVSIINVGSFDESLTTLVARYFPGRSFNYLIGISRQTYDASLGSDLLARVSGGTGQFGLIAVESLGIQAGLGNRWEWASGLTVGVDWLVVNIPVSTLASDVPALQYVSDQGDRQRIEDILSFMRKVPTFVALRTTLAYTF